MSEFYESDLRGGLACTRFAVKDREAFLADPEVQALRAAISGWGTSCHLDWDGVLDEKDGRFAFGFRGQCPSIEWTQQDDETAEEVARYNMIEIVSRHIADGEVAQITISIAGIYDAKGGDVGGQMWVITNLGIAALDARVTSEWTVGRDDIAAEVASFVNELSAIGIDCAKCLTVTRGNHV